MRSKAGKANERHSRNLVPALCSIQKESAADMVRQRKNERLPKDFTDRPRGSKLLGRLTQPLEIGGTSRVIAQ